MTACRFGLEQAVMNQGIDIRELPAVPTALEELFGGMIVFSLLANWILLFMGMAVHYPILTRNISYGQSFAWFCRTLGITQGLFCIVQIGVLANLEWWLIQRVWGAAGKALSGGNIFGLAVLLLIYVVLIILPGVASMALWFDIGKRCSQSKSEERFPIT
jgi:hypothetical protein